MSNAYDLEGCFEFSMFCNCILLSLRGDSVCGLMRAPTKLKWTVPIVGMGVLLLSQGGDRSCRPCILEVGLLRGCVRVNGSQNLGAFFRSARNLKRYAGCA